MTDTHWLAARAARGDYEAAAAFEILTSSPFARDYRAWKHVDDEHSQGIDWAAMLEDGTWSSGERALLELGRALWTGAGKIDAGYLFTSLGDGFTQIVVDAITARRGYRPLPAPSPLEVTA